MKAVRPVDSRQHFGFTLLELLTTISILAIVLALAAPGLRAFTQNNRAAAQANDLLSALSLARNEAVTRNAVTTICASVNGTSCSGGNDWSGGWLIFVDRAAPQGAFNPGPGGDLLLRMAPALPAGQLTGNLTGLSWRPNGFLAGVVPASFESRVAGCSGQQARDITVTLQGRTAVQPADCDPEG